MNSTKLGSLTAIAGAFAVAVALSGCDQTPRAEAASGPVPPPPVEAAQPLIRPVTEWDEYTGRFEAIDRVDLRARVSGYLDAVHFKDGQLVREGSGRASCRKRVCRYV